MKRVSRSYKYTKCDINITICEDCRGKLRGYPPLVGAFQLLRPMETLPVPYEVVLEKQVSPAYHLEGRGRPQDHAQIVCTISGEGAFRYKEKVYKLTPGMAFMSQLGDPDTAYYYPGHAAEPWIFLWISFDGFRAVEIIREMNERYGYVFRLPLDTGFVKHLEHTGASGHHTFCDADGRGKDCA